MKWNVAQLLRSPTGTDCRYAFDDEGRQLGGLASGITGSVRLIRTNKGILALARGQASAECTCSRCLDRFEYPARFDIAEEFWPSVDVEDGSRMDEASDAVLTIDERHILDLSKLVAQDILADLPMKPLCAEDCPGICATCGAQLRFRPCECPAGGSDSRWDKLAGIRLEIGGAP